MFHELNENIVDQNYFIICECGQPVDLATLNGEYQTQEFNDDGEPVLKICSHGVVVFDTREDL